MLEVLSLDCV